MNDHRIHEQIRLVKPRCPPVAAAGGGGGNRQHHRRGAAPGRHAVGRQPSAGQAARHCWRPAVRQARPGHRGHRTGRRPGGPGARVAAPAGAFRAVGRVRPGVLADHLHHRRQRLPARRAAAAADGAPIRPGARRGAARDSIRRADAGDAAPRSLPARHQPAPARGQRHPAKTPVRDALPRVLRPRRARRAAGHGRVPGGAPHHRGL
ncbi:hypothetical protein POHY109586_22750 [Polaromonas hydrogenivorans]